MLVCFIAGRTWNEIPQLSCEERGGVPVKSLSTYVCIDNKILK